MRVWYTGSAIEGVGRTFVILELHVVNETQVVVQAPVIGIVLNSIIHQCDGTFWLSSTILPGGQEAAAKIISDGKMWIQMRRDFEKRRQEIVVRSLILGLPSEVLHGARPINACHESVVAEAGPLDHLG